MQIGSDGQPRICLFARGVTDRSFVWTSVVDLQICASGHKPAIVVAVLYIFKYFIYEKNGSTARPMLFMSTSHDEARVECILPRCSICVFVYVFSVCVCVWVSLFVLVVTKKCAFSAERLLIHCITEGDTRSHCTQSF